MEDLWILYSISFKEDMPNPATRMLDEAFKNCINAKLMFYDLFQEKDNKIYYDSKEISDLPKLVLLRGNDIKVCEIFEKRGIKIINSSYTIINCCDKLKTHNIANNLGINQIKTIHSTTIKYDEIVNNLGLPFILKYRFGKQGNNIYVINNEKEYNDILKTINLDEYIIQEFIKTSYGKDVRVFIVGDKVIGACERKNESGFMSNLAQGGLSYHFELNDKIKEQSLRLSKELKGDIISVDYIFGDNNELLFCEANTNPGFASFNYLGYPMRKIFMDYIKELLRYI